MSPGMSFRWGRQRVNQMLPSLPRIIGMSLVLAAVVEALLFHFLIVAPAMAPKASGGYGEMYGPMSQLRYVVYFFVACQVVVGITIFLAQPDDDRSA